MTSTETRESTSKDRRRRHARALKEVAEYARKTPPPGKPEKTPEKKAR
jgi:hypothetical protein